MFWRCPAQPWNPSKLCRLRGVDSLIPSCSWLSCAELRTSSQSSQVLPRPLYLSHQFSFHGLGDDYHGRLRRFQLDTLGPKIEVRKEVEISAYVAGAGEA